MLLAALAAVVLAASSGAQDAPRPSVVVIMTDDQTYEDMAAMPLTRRLVGGAGTTFRNAYASYPLCCPSRATFLTGQYAHNHGVRTNTPPHGGVEALDAERTLPVWLSRGGYDTSHIGKYLNGYGLRRSPTVPPGWRDWHATIDKSTYQMWGYRMHENGSENTYGNFDDEDPSLYQTDVLRDKAVQFVDGHGEDSEPFFLSLNFVAPHGEVAEPGSLTRPYVRPAPRHEGRFRGLRLPRTTAAGESDVSDKPPVVRRLSSVRGSRSQRILDDYRARRESLLAVDEAVAAVIGALERTGRLGSTYVAVTSDNGFFQGEHRITKGKYLAYEPSTHVPLLIRGPGIAPGTVSDELVSNADLGPTVLDAAGATADIPVDGRSILPFARAPGLRSARPILHEGLIPGDIDRDGTARPGSTVGVYHAIRTSRYLYVRWKGGARELYDRRRDPRELDSRHADLRYRKVAGLLGRELQRLRGCSGPDCARELQGLDARLAQARPSATRRVDG